MLSIIQLKMYDGLIEEVDGIDNGIEPGTGTKNYKVTSAISNRVARLYPEWNEEYTSELEQERFRLAMGMMMKEFSEHLHEIVDVLLPARIIVEKVGNPNSFHFLSTLLFDKENMVSYKCDF